MMAFLSSQSQTTYTPHFTVSTKSQGVFSLYQNPVQLVLIEYILEGDKREIINNQDTPVGNFLSPIGSKFSKGDELGKSLMI
jgi:hypothetical protein